MSEAPPYPRSIEPPFNKQNTEDTKQFNSATFPWLESYFLTVAGIEMRRQRPFILSFASYLLLIKLDGVTNI